MKEYYKSDSGLLQVYEGDSLLAESVIPVKSVDLIILTPFGKKNVKEHYPEMVKKHFDIDPKDYVEPAWLEFTQSWVAAFSRLLMDKGYFLVTCLPSEKDGIQLSMTAAGYNLVEQFEFDVAQLSLLGIGPYKHNKDLYLLFGKDEVATEISMDKVQYPKELIRKVIKKVTALGGVVFHPFANTSKAAVVATKIFRQCIVISDNVFWCKVAVERVIDEKKDFEWSKGLM